jgi:cytochrome P450 family 103
VSETMRLEPSLMAAPRTVTEPIEICGIERPAGTIVVCTFLTANRDPAVWHDPDAFIPRRIEDPVAPRLLTFGGGPHYCLGAALARMTIEESVRGVAELALTLAEAPGEIEWLKCSAGVRQGDL